MKFQYGNIVGGKILIMDGEADLCLLMKTYFLRKGCQVFMGHRFEDVLRLVSQVAPDCVIVPGSLKEGRNKLIESVLERSANVQLIVYNGEVVHDKGLTPW